MNKNTSKIIIGITCGTVVFLLGYTGYRTYQVWRQSHWLTMAGAFAAKSDGSNEIICLQQALQLNPQNVEACRLVAAMSAAAHSPDAVGWRQRILELQPKSLEDRLALVQTAVSFHDYLVASNALAGVDGVGQKTAIYHNAAGALACGVGRISEAEMHFTEAVRLEPDNPIPQMNLAVIRLHGTNSSSLAQARMDLKQISLNPTNSAIRSQAQRELVIDALRFGDASAILDVAKELAESPNATFSDMLLRLEVLRQAKNIEYKAVLAQYEHDAAPIPTKITEMAGWLMHSTSPNETLAWLQSLPITTLTNQPAALLAAQCQLQLRDWQGLQAALQNQRWAEIDFVRHAFLARALREQDLIAASTAEWGVALNCANEQKGRLILLFRAAAEWHWSTEAEQILWTLVNRYPEEQWAISPLSQALILGGRTRPLMQLLSVLSKRTPADLVLKNNLAITALLLGAHELNPDNLALEVYSKDHTTPAYASTYAFSLYLQKNYTEALKVMQLISANELEKPPIAGYYGIILEATGQKELARVYLRRVSSARLLPEEQSLFQLAMLK